MVVVVVRLRMILLKMLHHHNLAGTNIPISITYGPGNSSCKSKTNDQFQSNLVVYLYL